MMTKMTYNEKNIQNKKYFKKEDEVKLKNRDDLKNAHVIKRKENM